MVREPNIWDAIKLFEDLRNDMNQLLSMIARNRNALSDIKEDFKKLLNVMDKMTREDNMRTFRKFVKELERFNKNAERMSKELEEMKNIMKGFDELAKFMKGG
ncbi:MAG: hypothetical protein DRI33_04890 [Caldiserica bacterium]|nr:MAG: hypothetical protein DRI33_04890 [Caldisericota bacterium]